MTTLTKKEEATLKRLRRKWATRRATRAQILRVMELQHKRNWKPTNENPK